MSRLRNTNDGGATPTTSCLTSPTRSTLIEIVRPTMPGIAAVAALPKGVADHHDARSTGVVGGREGAAEHGLDAQHGEEVRRHATAEDDLGRAVAGDVRERECGGRHVGERPVHRAPVLVVAGSGHDFWGNPPRFSPPRP